MARARSGSGKGKATRAKAGGAGSRSRSTARKPASRASAARRGAKGSGRKRAVTRRSSWLESRQARDALGLMLVALGCYLAGLYFLSWQGGAVGSAIDHSSMLLVGHAAYVFPLLALLVGGLLVARSELIDPGPFRAGLYLLVPSVLLAFGADRFGLGNGHAQHDLALASAHVVDHGGWAGGSLYFASYTLFGDAGTTIVCLLGIVLSGLFLTGSSVQAITQWWARRIGGAAVAATQVAGQAAVNARDASKQVATRMGEATQQAAAATRQLAEQIDEHGVPFDASQKFPDIFGDVPGPFSRAEHGDDDFTLQATPPKPKRKRAAKAVAEGEEDDQLALLEPTGGEDAEHPQVEAASEMVLRARVIDNYTLPSAELLKRSKEVKATANAAADVEKTKQLLVETFGHFGIQAKVVGLVPGPRVSRYELSLAPGTKMSKVENLRKDLAYALATTEIRILAPIPGKSAVGIEVENPSPSMVTLGDIVSKPPKGASPLFVWFGKDITGDVIGADLAKMPHLLVAGTTGAGKSGCMNAMLSSIVLGSSPDEVRMLLIDPKKVELSTYEGLPHLLTPVVTNMKKAANALGNVVAQMEERYSSMELAGARTLPEYNKMRVARGQETEPYVLIVIDELADLVMQARSDVEDAVIRIAQKGRAAGFHLVVATQRPSVDVITGMIKSNVPSRIAFAVSSQTDSRVILDQNGAETLLGSGDMLFKPVWARSVQRVQGAWISEQEVRAVCDAARAQRKPDFDIDLLSEPEPVAGEHDDPGHVDEDDRLPEAIRLVAEFQTCSASFFQRRMRVGYTRGARLVDMLERRGLVAPGEGPRPRNVLITADDLPRVLDEMAGEQLALADAADDA